MTAIQPLPSHHQQQSRLKVCGLTRIEQIQELISLETDFLGFIFYEKSPRYVLNYLTLYKISAIPHTKKVGVFVNEKLENIVRIAETAGLNFIQLHGDEHVDFVSGLRKNLSSEIEIIKVLRIGNKNVNELQEIIHQNQNTVNYFLFDTDSAAFGGTGKTFDWNILNELEIPLPYFLSGGISLENIENSKLLKNKPFALDINSQFEIKPGIKDLEKIKILKNNIK